MLRLRTTIVVLAAGLVAAVGVASSCNGSDPAVVAKRIASRADLIGGPGALGDVGDYLLANEQIRVIIQDEDFSRGFGIYGGTLVDADLVRPQTAGDDSGGVGRDNFSELFPAVFLLALEPCLQYDPNDSTVCLQGGLETRNNEDGSASVIVTGKPSDFIFLAQRVNDVLVDADSLQVTNEYRLHPGVRYVEITTTITNVGIGAIDLPDPGAGSLLPGFGDFPFPLGDIILFGAGNSVFAEGAGFDLRFTLEDAYDEPLPPPQLPGIIAPYLATRGPGVSYGFASGVTEDSESFLKTLNYENSEASDLLVPFTFSGFTGSYYAAAPRELQPRETFSVTKYFIVGGGDVASIRDVVLDLRNEEVGRLSGQVIDNLTGAPEANASVVTYDAAGTIVNQHTTDSGGRFIGNYPAGRYSYRVVTDGRRTTDPVFFDIAVGEKTFVRAKLPAPGQLNVRIVRGEDAELMPAKCMVVGTYALNAGDAPGRDFLYDLSIGEEYRRIDLVTDTFDPNTRRFIEQSIFTTSGQTQAVVRPGEYELFCSRGPEWTVARTPITIKAGEVVNVVATLRRAIDTKGWASADFHLHGVNSVDSFVAMDDRVRQVAAEGVDIACSSDHNFVTDYSGPIQRLSLEEWVQGMVGLEMSPLEIGHFNSFPLAYNPGPVTNGSFAWSGRPPQDLFDDMRALGRHGPENTIVQVNHPRDSILGYFNDYNLDPDTARPQPDNGLLAPEGPEFGVDKFSFDFDAIEVFNAKRFDLLYNYRVPEELPPPPLPEVIPPAGTVLRDENGEVAFPGALEDWFTLLNNPPMVNGAFRYYAATGNSDTHSLEDEAGYPRTWVPVTEDRPGLIDELEIVNGLKSLQAIASNGPFIVPSVRGQGCTNFVTGEALDNTDCGMGSLARAENGSVLLKADVQVAPWIKINRVNFIVGGESVSVVPGDNQSLSSVSHRLDVTADTWMVVEVSGTESMFPMLTPRELAPLDVTNALGGIAGSFGLDLAPFGNLAPDPVGLSTPYGFTNPIFIDGDGDGVYTPPATQTRQSLIARSKEGRVLGKRPSYRGLPTLARMFQLFAHSGGH